MPTEMQLADVLRLMEGGAQLIEVLPQEEYEEAHLPGAINIPLKRLNDETTARLDKNLAVITYCFDYQCDLSARAARRLETLGFRQSHHYRAGKADWIAMGLPIEGSQAEIPTIGGLARRNVPTCRLEERVGEVRARLEESDRDVCVVVDEQNVVLGRLRGKAWAANADTPVEQIMENGPTTYRPNLSAQEAAGYLAEHGVASVLITTSIGELIGVFYSDDVSQDARQRQAATVPA